MIGWTTSGMGILGYRVLDDKNNILYDGKINFSAEDFLKTAGKYHEITNGEKVYAEVKPFVVEPSVIEGPFVTNLTHQGAVIFLKTNTKMKPFVQVNDERFSGKSGTYHEIEITDLQPDTEYEYTLMYGKFEETYSFRTAPEPGARSEFSFSTQVIAGPEMVVAREISMARTPIS